MKVTAELSGQDWIEVDTELSTHLNVIGCSSLLRLIKEFKLKYGDNLKNWMLPCGSSHAELLLKEALLKMQGNWKFPYSHVEICHCRGVNTSAVDQAIVNGAHTPEKVSRLTSASTACGTCRLDVEKIISYRLS